MSNAEDLNRLTACSLVLLGHIFYVLGNHRVRRNNNKMLNNIQYSFSVPEKYLVNEVLNQTKLEFALKNIHLPSGEKCYCYWRLWGFRIIKEINSHNPAIICLDF